MARVIDNVLETIAEVAGGALIVALATPLIVGYVVVVWPISRLRLRRAAG